MRGAVIVRPPDGDPFAVPFRADETDLYFEIDRLREGLMGYVDGEIHAFTQFKNDEDFHDAIDDEIKEEWKRYDEKTQRTLAAIFGVDRTPQLEVKTVNLDGVTIFEVNLDPVLPGHVALVPTRVVPQ